MNQKGQGFSKFKDIYINRFKKTSDEAQGIFVYIKNIKTNTIWSSNYIGQKEKNQISFMPDKTQQETNIDGIKTILTTNFNPFNYEKIFLVTCYRSDNIFAIC